MRVKRKYSFLLVLGLFTFLQAQLSPFKSFDITIYPEYMHPGVGILVEGEILEGQFPRYVELMVPSETTVALLHMGERQESQRIEVVERDGKSYLPLDVTEAEFAVEFYYNPFTAGSVRREMTFEFTTNEQLPEFHMVIQEPVAAENFEHSMFGAEAVEREFGLTYYRQHINGLQPGRIHAVNLSYDNPTNTLTQVRLQAIMQQRQAASTAQAPAESPTSNMLMVILLIVVIAAGLFFILRSTGGRWQAAMAGTSGGPAKATTPSKGRGKGAAAQQFCPHCGASWRAGARFCANCGKEL